VSICQTKAHTSPRRRATVEDVKRFLGSLDDATVMAEILATIADQPAADLIALPPWRWVAKRGRDKLAA